MRREPDATREFSDQFGSFLVWKRLEFLEQLFRGLRHGFSVPRCVAPVKSAVALEA